jgi:hypothetical protein
MDATEGRGYDARRSKSDAAEADGFFDGGPIN